MKVRIRELRDIRKRMTRDQADDALAGEIERMIQIVIEIIHWMQGVAA